jgi:hypothetical protein
MWSHHLSSLPIALLLRLALLFVVASLWTVFLCPLSFEEEALVAIVTSSVAVSSYSKLSHTLDRSTSLASLLQDANDKREWPSTSLRSAWLIARATLDYLGVPSSSHLRARAHHLEAFGTCHHLQSLSCLARNPHFRVYEWVLKVFWTLPLACTNHLRVSEYSRIRCWGPSSPSTLPDPGCPWLSCLSCLVENQSESRSLFLPLALIY